MVISRIFIMVMAWLISANAFAVDVSFTMDDPEVTDSPIYSVYDRNDKNLQAF